MLRDNVFSLASYYTRTDIELIIQHLCRSDQFRHLYCMFAVFLYVRLYVCMYCTVCTNKIIIIIISSVHNI